MLNILFSENEQFYRSLGLQNKAGLTYHFDGMRLYKKNINILKKYDLFVCAFYSLPHNTLLTKKFDELEIKTVIVCDGIYEISNALNNIMLKKYNLNLYFPILQDYLIFPSNTECILFDDHVRMVNYMPKRIISKENKIPLPREKKILITTANTAYFNDGEYKCLIKLLKDIIAYLLDNDIEFAIRIFDKIILNDLDVSFQKIKNDIDKPFEDTLAAYSSVISTPSSIVITAMYHERSVGQLVYRDTPQLMLSGWLFPSVSVFMNSLSSFLKLDNERMIIQNRFLSGYLKDSTDLTTAITKVTELEKININKNRDCYDHINQQHLNMLNSFFNFNLEFFVRKIYNKIKKNELLKKIRTIIK
ncbi:TPA: hypothetical protein ACS8BP_002330 [Providencia alcalifaciens]